MIQTTQMEMKMVVMAVSHSQLNLRPMLRILMKNKRTVRPRLQWLSSQHLRRQKQLTKSLSRLRKDVGFLKVK